MKKMFLTAISFLLIHISACSAQQPGYKILNKIKVEGEGGWDYLAVDTMYNRLFISHATVVNILDLVSGRFLQTIQDTKGVHGIAFAYDLDKGFISNGKDSSVTFFELKSMNATGSIKVTGGNPDAVLYDPFSKKVFTFNARNSNATVIDAASEKILSTIPLDGKPEFAVSDLKGKVFVNIEDKSELCAINTVSMKVERCWKLSPGEEPSGLAIDLKNQKLFSVCDNKKMVVSDIAAGKVIATLPIGERVDGAAFDASTGTVFSSNGDGTLTVIKQESAGKYSVLQNLSTQKGARTIALNPKTHHVYLPTAEFGDTPAATPENLHPRPAIKPGTFVILECGM
jgi:DNA-binding beta-propeller fold protein YncE